MFEWHFASFIWQKLSVIFELEKQSMTFLVGCLWHTRKKSGFGLFLIVRTIPKPAKRIAEGLDGLLTTEILQDTAKSREATQQTQAKLFLFILGSSHHDSFQVRSSFFLRFQQRLVVWTGFRIDFSGRISPVFAEQSQSLVFSFWVLLNRVTQ